MKNSEYHSGDVKAVCATKLRIEFREGKECNGWYIFQGIKVARISVPQGKKFVPPGTYASMARQLKLTVKEFDQLLDCPLTRDTYDELLTERTAR